MRDDPIGTRILITGARGFVGHHLADALRRICGDVAVLATSRRASHGPGEPARSMPPGIAALDVTDRSAVDAVIGRCMPTHVIHLAGLATPAAAQADPDRAWRVHVKGTLNLASAILEQVPACTLLHVGSGLVYGASAETGLPLNEAALLAPVDDYGVTKAAGDLALGALARRGLRCVRLRPFNHTGAGQTDAYVVPAFAMQVARIEAGLQPPIIRVGNLDAERDFLDVRDVALAYALAVRHAPDLAPGVIFNVASGTPRRIGDILQHLLARSRVEIRVLQDPGRMRPADLPRILGDAGRLREQLGWVPEHGFEDTLAAVLADCRRRAAGP